MSLLGSPFIKIEYFIEYSIIFSVWTFSAIATVITALLVTVAAVLSPKESTAEFKIQNSVWYLVCILLRAGSGYNCQAGATRLFCFSCKVTTFIFQTYICSLVVVHSCSNCSIYCKLCSTSHR